MNLVILITIKMMMIGDEGGRGEKGRSPDVIIVTTTKFYDFEDDDCNDDTGEG